MRTNSRVLILEKALGILRRGGSVSLESAARESGLTKPGLMYHFPTKEALMLALVDTVVDAWVTELNNRLGSPLQEARPGERIAAYVDWCLEGDFDIADLVILTDPRLREPLAARWAERLSPWFAVPETTPALVRGRLTAARLMADGTWFATATGMLSPTPDEREAIRAAAAQLLDN